MGNCNGFDMENMVNHYEVGCGEGVSEANVKKLDFIIRFVPVLIALILALTSFAGAFVSFKLQRRETCLYSDTIDWEAGMGFMKLDCKAEFISENEKGMAFRFDGIDRVYEGACDVYYLYEDNKLYGVIGYIPYSQELMDKVIGYYNAEKVDGTEQYIAKSGDNELIISSKNDKINIVIRQSK